MKDSLWLRFGLAVGLIFAGTQTAWAKWNPKAQWRTVETEHFLVHYEHTLDPLAGRIARIAEEAHAQVTERLGWVPRGKTHLVIGDRLDVPAGLATPFPYNLIVLNVAPPVAIRFMNDFTDWLRELIGHEYAHIVHTDKIGGAPAVLRNIFGRWWVPNAMAPQWLVEGYAVMEESLLTEGGRGNAPYTDMVLRTAVLYDRFPRIDQVGGGLLQGLAGNAGYLFGGKFLDHLRTSRGEGEFRAFTDSFGTNVIPYRVKSTGRKVYGRSFESLWREWEFEVREEVGSRVEAVRREGLREGRAVYRSTEAALLLSRGASPGELLVATRSLEDPPRLFRMALDAETGGTDPGLRALARDFSASALAAHPSKPILVYSDEDTHDRFDTVSELFEMDLETGKARRRTRGGRLCFPTFEPNGDRVIAVQYRDRVWRLVEFEVESGTITSLPGSAVTDAYYGPSAVSPDGREIAVSRWKDGRWDVVRLDREGREIGRVTADRAVDFNPSYSPDGRWLLFDSDRTGIPNIFAWDRSTGEIRQVTNVETGAFQAVVVANRESRIGNREEGWKIAYLRYQPEGHDVYVVEWAPESWPLAPPQAAERQVHTGPAAESAAASEPVSRPYSPLPTLLIPRFWIPEIFFNERGAQYGVVTFSVDPILQHAWMVEANYRPDVGRAGGLATYQTDLFEPTLLAEVRRSIFSAGPLEREFYQRRHRGEVDALFEDGSYTVSTGYFFEDRDNFGKDKAEEYLAAGHRAGLRVGLGYGNRKFYRYSISPERGAFFHSSWEIAHGVFGGDLDQQVLRADYRRFHRIAPLPHHVVAWRLAGGAALGEGSRRAFALGGFLDESPIVSLPDRNYMLRGLPFNYLEGRRFTLGSLEYRFPVARIERGVRLWPVFVQQLHALAFLDGGLAHDERYALDLVEIGAGAELGTDVVLFYGVPTAFHLGYAKAVTERDLWDLYLRIGASF
ncbi:MAG: PD40 domain-containing protein [Nitrospirae bacterium]|nr:PD40 domain-containing protein [Nitrospirota bacterium]